MQHLSVKLLKLIFENAIPNFVQLLYKPLFFVKSCKKKKKKKKKRKKKKKKLYIFKKII